MATNIKPPCKYGKKCYRKNADHLRNFSHPGRDHDDDGNDSSSQKKMVNPPKAPKRTIESYFTKTKTDHTVSSSDSDSDNANKKARKSKYEAKPALKTGTDDLDDNIASDPVEKEPKEKLISSDNDTEEESFSTPPSSPEDIKENISTKFLVKMPEDFYHFWDFCKSLNPSNPRGAFVKRLKLNLVGPFDILSGLHKDITVNKRGKRPNYLLHYRFFYDPPEFQTVLVATDSSFHFGYFRDDPQEDPVFLASNNPDALSGKEKITPTGDNLFAALHIHATKVMKTENGAAKAEVEKLLKKLEATSESHGYSLAPTTKRMKERQKKVVCPTFHGAGLVVPVDENEIGYRPVPETPGDLRKMLRKIVDSKTKEEQNKNFDELQELITLVQFANDECDFGEGLELGLDLFSYGSKVFHPQIEMLMPLAYQFLKRNEFAQIINAHLKRRRVVGESVNELVL